MNTNKKPARKSKGVWIVRLIVTLVVLLMASLVVVVVVASYGNVSGVEFSPDTFRTRSFSYYEIPLIGLQFTKVDYNPVSSPVADDLAVNSWIPAPPAGPVTWHQVDRKRAGRVIWRGEPIILLYYLDIPERILPGGSQLNFSFNTPDAEWVKFNDDHPQLAAILWPAIVELARNDLYMYVPEVLDLARNAKQPAAFQTTLDAHLAETYTFVGTTRAELGAYPAAIKAFDAALAREPENVAARRGRAAAHEAAGNQEQADKDGAMADQLESQSS